MWDGGKHLLLLRLVLPVSVSLFRFLILLCDVELLLEMIALRMGSYCNLFAVLALGSSSRLHRLEIINCRSGLSDHVVHY